MRDRRAALRPLSVDVSWGDQDPAGIVYYPRFFAWADASGHQWFGVLGLPLQALLRARRLSFGLVACAAQFHSPARGGDSLRCRTRLTQLGDKTLELEHVFSNGRRRVATVTEVRICMDLRDPDDLRAASIPADLRRIFARQKPDRASKSRARVK